MSMLALALGLFSVAINDGLGLHPKSEPSDKSARYLVVLPHVIVFGLALDYIFVQGLS